ncbi:MAG: glycoside hydrolase family 88 protein [Chloroflexi bacterium]|nr:glycoside hydrolase family 88 protein [Chloroflexota bacterium]
MSQKNPSSLPSFISDALAYSLDMTRQNLTSLDNFPELAKDGKWLCSDDGFWTGGHWTGLLWLAYAHTGDSTIEHAARKWTRRLTPRQHDTTTHDLGFLFELSFLLGHKLTGDSSFKASAIQAARTLALRFNPKGKFFQAWGPLNGTPSERGRAIIDTMMNLDLLFWTTQETGEKKFAEMAITQAHTVLQRHVRSDWSTSHVTDFDPDTGEFIQQETAQGLSATSCWSRGQAWAVYGFAKCYRETGNATFLDAAHHLAEYCLHRLPPDRVPYWDYDSPFIPDDVRDSSAASILASASLLLATLDTANADCWHTEAMAMLESLWNSYGSRGTNEPCILLHGTRSKPEDSMDHGLIYGDYYFVEALTRLTKPELRL